ncbi:NAD(P)H-binding protein [Ursidibacter sp. B-7004-1]
MERILILGATGSLAKVVIDELLANTHHHLTLLARNPNKLPAYDSKRVRIVQGDVLDTARFAQVMDGHSVVYANLAGNLKAMAESIVNAMKQTGLKRLIFISSMGIYGETGENHGTILDPYRQSAQVVEHSGLEYTLIRPAWFTHSDEIDYQLTHKGEPFCGSAVSRKSIADLVIKLIANPQYAIGESLGIAKI